MIETHYLNLNDEDQHAELEVILTDNGHWGYDRVAFGEDERGIYVVDMNDDGETNKQKVYLKEGLTILDALNEGVAHGVLVEEGDEFLVVMDCVQEEWNEWMEVVIDFFTR
jgi:hypothetical protein